MAMFKLFTKTGITWFAKMFEIFLKQACINTIILIAGSRGEPLRVPIVLYVFLTKNTLLCCQNCWKLCVSVSLLASIQHHSFCKHILPQKLETKVKKYFGTVLLSYAMLRNSACFNSKVSKTLVSHDMYFQEANDDQKFQQVD